jgi:TatD DNase family protein
MIDTHCHLNFESYDHDRDEVVQRAAEAGVKCIINPGIDLPSSRAGIKLALRYDSVYAAVGIHPNSSASFAQADIAALQALAAETKVIAVGEIGLDYYRDRSPKSQQYVAFEAQLALAAELQLPVIIHNREASDDVLMVLENWVQTLPHSLKGRPGVLHSFSAPAQIAERALAIGFYLGFTGPITYKNADDTRSVARMTPLDRLLVETDGPFLTPVPHRGKRNEPAYIPYMVDRLGSLKEVPTDAMAQITTENAVRLFRLPA